MVRKNLFHSISAGALTVSLGLALPTAAHAQDVIEDDEARNAQEEAVADDDVVVITGLRYAIETATAQKKANTSIVEVVAAEDIGKLPDVSIADTLSRLPGLATQRLDGRANVVSIRGLAPDFTTTLLNGREQVSANNNRGVELDQYPSELINGAIVYKTPDASLIGQALGGTIDMQTIRPLAHGETTFVVGGRVELNDLGEINPDISNKGWRANASYVDQNADGTVGWAFGLSVMSSPTAEERTQIWGYPTTGSGEFIIGGIKPYIKSNKLDRIGAMGVLEFEPNDKVHLTLDGYWSQFKDEQRLRGLEIPLAWSGASLQPGYTVDPSTNLITEGTFTGVEVVGRNDFVDRDSEIFAGGINLEYQATDSLMIEADVGYSVLDKIESNAEIYLGTGRGSGVGAVDTLSFTFDENYIPQFTTGLNYGDPNVMLLTAPLSWCGRPGFPGDCQDGFINAPEIDDELKSLRLQATQDVGASDSIRIGVNYSDRNKQLFDEGYVLTANAYPADVAIPSNLLFSPVSLGFIGINSLIAFDSKAYYEAGNYVETAGSGWDASRLSNRYDITEKVLTGFAQYNFDRELGSVPVRGNVGVQVVHTDQEGSSFVARNDAGVIVAQPVTEGDKYTEILPSLNASFEVSEDTFIRVGLARLLARPRMDQLSPGGGFGYNPALATSTDINMSPWGGTVGNAALRPLIANAVDLSVEHYFAPRGYFAISGFYKDLESYIYRSSQPFDFTGYPFTGPEPVLFDGLVSQWTNEGSGEIYGAEATLSLPFETFTPALDGFGVFVSGSYTDSKVQQADGADPTRLPGLSEWVINSTAYYEKGGFQARVSGRYRSEFLAEVSGLSLARDFDIAEGELIVDAQIGYAFQPGSKLEGFSLLLTGSNLTNEPFVTYRNEEFLVRDYQNYGRTFSLGASYRF